ncbi:MAG: alpha-2-macroglobulin family protein, partial [Opitutae bacterium]|nr:alpha-2-macroglobulin family protein [Opitutae bacterium]
GLTVAEGQTDARGHIRFEQMNELKREKTPIMVVAHLGRDLSFLPLGREEHRLDFSRFDIGGMANQTSPNQVSASLFTDRGLYRPGETVHIGAILRTADWRQALAGMPVEIVITDPRGMVVLDERRATTTSGFDAIDFTTGPNAATGSYAASVYLVKNNRRSTFIDSIDFTVREFEPDRMKVDLHLAKMPASGWLLPEQVRPVVTARHLFGADASERRVTARMELAPSFPAFARYPDYRFHLEGMLKEGVDEPLAETRTGADGRAELQPDLRRFTAGAYRLRLTARVHEAKGGRNVAASQEALVASTPYLVGVRSVDSLDYVTRGAGRSCSWLAVRPDLEPTEVDQLTLSLIEYRHVSVLVKQESGAYKYESRRKEIVRANQGLRLDQAGTATRLPTEEPGDFAYELRDRKGTLLNRITWTVAGAGNLSRSLERNAELQVKLDKTSYAPGEPIRISLRAPYTGSGLITIERDRVYAHAWFTTETTSSVQTITVPEGLEGNGYVNVQFLRDPNSAEIFMSPLSSGVAPFAVSLAARTLPLTLASQTTIEPGQDLEIRLTAREAARAVVFAVDEGILQVARHKTPDPLGHFFAKRSLDVQTSQILGLILPEFNRLLAAAAPGGDGDEAIGSHLNPFKRKRRGPVAYWSGVIDLHRAGRGHGGIAAFGVAHQVHAPVPVDVRFEFREH